MKPIPECPRYVADPQAVWFEEHWRPIIISQQFEIIKLKTELALAIDLINAVKGDLEFFHYCNRKYIEAGKDYQSIDKIGTPIRAASERITKTLSKIKIEDRENNE